ncbi:MAG: 50S ribosomal protein L18 [Prolixibacteraceae bacterium]|jgi:large subunit ribosomal protein L18|nr:50S ribosomal protein L18 [Prolixibacteraceae bacterium]
MALTKQARRYRIKKRIRKIVNGTPEIPRFNVYRSNKQIHAQIIDDLSGKTLISASSLDKEIDAGKVNKTEQAAMVGKLIAEKAKKANIEKVVFDRNGYLYHGRVKSIAEAARKGGLKF